MFVSYDWRLQVRLIDVLMSRTWAECRTVLLLRPPRKTQGVNKRNKAEPSYIMTWGFTWNALFVKSSRLGYALAMVTLCLPDEPAVSLLLKICVNESFGFFRELSGITSIPNSSFSRVGARTQLVLSNYLFSPARVRTNHQWATRIRFGNAHHRSLLVVTRKSDTMYSFMHL